MASPDTGFIRPSGPQAGPPVSHESSPTSPLLPPRPVNPIPHISPRIVPQDDYKSEGSHSLHDNHFSPKNSPRRSDSRARTREPHQPIHPVTYQDMEGLDMKDSGATSSTSETSSDLEVSSTYLVVQPGSTEIQIPNYWTDTKHKGKQSSTHPVFATEPLFD